MKTTRLTLAALGIAAMAYAIAGAASDPDITPGRHIGFLLTVLAVHDGLLLPAFIGIGALTHRYAPTTAKAAIQAALLATAALTLIATPLILGYGRLADNPSALPRNYPAGLAIVLGIVWLTTAGFIHVRRTRRRSPAQRQVDARAPDPTAPTAGSPDDPARAEGGTDAQHHRVRGPTGGSVRVSFADLRALFINCTLKRSPELSHTGGLIDVSQAIMAKQGVTVEVIRAVDHDIATGVWPDMTEHGWDRDEWPALYHGKVLPADILVIAGPIWLGDNSSVTKRIIERLYGNSHLLNEAGQYAYYGRVGGCLITGNEDGVKHCASNVLYSLQHLGYTVPPQADAGWIGEAGPGPSYLDPGSGGPQNDFTNRNTTFMTWNLMHLARMLKDAGGIPAHGNQRSQWDAGARFDFPNPEYR